jgi:rubrerythrin
MNETRGSGALFVEGYSGLPVETHSASRHSPGSIEWLLDAVERHASAESEALGQYEYLASASNDPVIALVMRIIVEDEERHHGLLRRIESSLRDALNWTHSSDSLPDAGNPQHPVASDLAGLARELIDEEHTSARLMRELAHKERNVSSGLHSLLLEMMAMDSDKHARLLQFVRERLAARTAAQNGPAD